MGRIQMESHPRVPCPSPQPKPQPQPQPQAHASYSYSPQTQQAIIHPRPQNNVNVVQVPQYQISSPMTLPQNQCVGNTIPSNGSLQRNAATGTPVQRPPMPSPQIKVVPPTGPWTTRLFDWMQDPTNSLITALFPCVTFGQIADVLDNGHTTCAFSGIVYAVAPCLVSGPFRKKLRQRFGLVEAPAADWIIHSMFEPCALCQEYRELNNRGINPALGRHGNLNKHQSSPVMVPPRTQMMN